MMEIILVLSILGAALVLFVTEWLRVDLVAMRVLLALALTGLLTPAEAVAGFSSPAVMTLCGVFVLSAGLRRTGVANYLARWVEHAGGREEARMTVSLMATAAVLSFFMNTIAIVALLLPAVMDWSRRSGLAPSRLLMPMTVGALLGGMTTMFATLPNLLASSALRSAGLEPFGVFDFLPVGGAAAAAGIGFMALVGRHWLPKGDRTRETPEGRGVRLEKHYELHERMFVLRLPPGCVLAGRTLEQSRLGPALGLHVVGILRGGRTELAPTRHTVMQAGDRLLIQGTPDQLKDLDAWRGLIVEERKEELAAWMSDDVVFAEAQLSEDSRLADCTLPWLEARRIWGVNVLAIRRNGEIQRSHLQDTRLRAGDILLGQGARDSMAAWAQLTGLQGYRELTREEVAARYDLQSRLFTLRLPEDSPLADHTLAQSRLGEALGVTVLALSRGPGRIVMPGPQEMLAAGDTLLVAGRSEDLVALQGLKGLQLEQQVAAELPEFESERLGMIEAVISPRSNLPGKTLRQIRFRDRYGLSVLGVWRSGKSITHQLRDVALQFGDALLIHGPREKLRQFAREPDFIVLTQTVQEPPLSERAWAALVSALVFLVLAATGLTPVYVAAFTGATLMVLSGCLRLEEVYASVDWKAVVLTAGMLPLAWAMQDNGAAAWLAQGLMSYMEDATPLLLIAGLFVVTSLGTCVMPSSALVVVIAPIALQTSQAAGVSPHAAMMAVALAASGSFTSPVSHPSNVLIMGPGGYRFTDFLKVGIPLTAVVLIVVLLVLPRVWPLTRLNY